MKQAIYIIADDITAFGEVLASGDFVFQQDESILYKLEEKAAATDTLSTLTKQIVADGLKLDSIEDGAQVNVNADWDAVSGDSEILNKPSDVTDLSLHTSSELSDGSDLMLKNGTSNLQITNSAPRVTFKQTDAENYGRWVLDGLMLQWQWLNYATGAFVQSPFNINVNAPSGALRVAETALDSTVDINIASGKVYRIGGTQISTNALLDGSNLVKNTGTSTDNAISRFDGTTGKVIQNSIGKIDDDGNLSEIKDTSTETITIDSAVRMSYDAVNQSLKFNFL